MPKVEIPSVKNYGVAVDIGTTTVVIMLWNVVSGEMIDIFAATNPQGAYGADVISRITYVMEQEENLDTIQKTIIDCINKAVSAFAEREGIKTSNIYQMTVVGNTTMSHIFLGVNPAQLALAPFTPVFTAAVDTAAKDLKRRSAPKPRCMYLPILPVTSVLILQQASSLRI